MLVYILWNFLADIGIKELSGIDITVEVPTVEITIWRDDNHIMLTGKLFEAWNAIVPVGIITGIPV